MENFENLDFSKGEKAFERMLTPTMELFLGYWEEKSSRYPNRIFSFPTKGVFTTVGLGCLAKAVLDLAFAWEEYHAPKSKAEWQGETLVLSWRGTWTEGRWIEMRISVARPFHSTDRRRWNVLFRWDSGTGQESTYLDLRRFFADVEAEMERE